MEPGGAVGVLPVEDRSMLTPGDLDHMNRQVVAMAEYLVKRGEKQLTAPVVTTALCVYLLVVLVWLAVI